MCSTGMKGKMYISYVHTVCYEGYYLSLFSKPVTEASKSWMVMKISHQYCIFKY